MKLSSGGNRDAMQLHAHRDRAVVAQQRQDLGDAVAAERPFGAGEYLVRASPRLHRDSREIVDGPLALVIEHGFLTGTDGVEHALRNPELDAGPGVHGPDILSLP